MINAISVVDLSKAYKIYPNKSQRFLDLFLPVIFKGKSRYYNNWILKKINFDIAKGEAIGIVGVNGAGKSTLLKMITGTTTATEGSINVRGRIAALLELGMGFHPDFTGRENARMSAQLMGLSKGEIEKYLPDIEEFAGIGDYFDLPTRQYSSGMQARVAFSVATAVQPDILIVDEALAVGDIAFQAKCMQRMEKMQRMGVTILFVSHAMNQIRQFCDRAIYLSNGKIRAIGTATEICDLYQNDTVINKKKVSESVGYSDGNIAAYKTDEKLRINSVEDASGSLDIKFTAFELHDSQGEEISIVEPEKEVTFLAYLTAESNICEGAVVGMLLGDKTGYPVASFNTNLYSVKLPAVLKGENIIVKWRFVMPLYSGEYRVDIGIKPDAYAVEFYDRVFCAKTFSAQTPIHLLRENFGGFLHVPTNIEITKV